MDGVPRKYKTSCSSRIDESVIYERVFEAININEAEARAMLNCVNAGNKREDISIKAEKIFR